MLSPACTNLTQLQMNQSPSYHIPSSRHLFCGNSTTKSKPPLLPNLLRQEVQKGRTMYHPTYAYPFWTLSTPLRDRDTQAVTEPSRFSRTVTGGPTWPGMSPAMSKDVRSVPSLPHHNRLPEGKLVPLPIPHRPWSHLSVYFATDLPPSNGFTYHHPSCR